MNIFYKIKVVYVDPKEHTFRTICYTECHFQWKLKEIIEELSKKFPDEEGYQIQITEIQEKLIKITEIIG